MADMVAMMFHPSPTSGGEREDGDTTSGLSR